MQNQIRNAEHKVTLDKLLSACSDMLCNPAGDSINIVSNEIGKTTNSAQVVITTEQVKAKIIDATRVKTE